MSTEDVAAAYARAERFLSWNKDKCVDNADIEHHWIADEDRFWYLRTTEAGKKEFVIVDAASGERSAAFDPLKLAEALSQATHKSIDPGHLPFSRLSFTQDRRCIEFQVDAVRWAWDLAAGVLRRAPDTPPPHEVVSPDGKWVAFRKEENIWIRPVSGGNAHALTTDGIEHYGYGGLPGCSLRRVTELRKGKPIRAQVLWSPDSRYLLTYRVDERRVQDLFLIQAVPEDGSIRPKLYTYRYPMAGDEHATQLELVIFDVASRHRVNLSSISVLDLLIPIEGHTVWWTADSGAIYFLERDRFSKWITLKRADVRAGTVREITRETSATVALVSATNPYEHPAVRTLANGDVIWYSRRSGWGHLYYYDSTGSLRNPITQGEWLVRRIVRVDEAARRIYFTASGREPGRDPYEQRLYRIGFDGSGLELLTPEEAEHDFTPPPAEDDAIVRPVADAEHDRFSPSGRYFVDSFSRPDVPPVLMLRDCDGREIRKLEEADISRLRAGGYRPVEPFEALAVDGRTRIYGNVFRPSHFDPARRYPIIEANYPGPQASRTRKTFTEAVFDKEDAQAIAELGFIVVTIDGRGTPHRSTSFTEYAYGRLDKASDLEDHVAALRRLAERYPYMDLDRVGIYGMSGGGFRAAQAILRYPDFYKVAVSAEGNHEQRGYSRSWGETYIGPVEDTDYPASATWPDAANLKGKLLLMHGELDDNVPPMQTMKLVDALIKANKDFDLLILPNENHQTAFKSPYFIRRKWDFFLRHLLGAEPPANYVIAPPPKQHQG